MHITTLSLLHPADLRARPLSRYWDASNFVDYCEDEAPRVISASIISIVTDILVFVLPLPTFWKLWLPKREKAVLIALMSMGLMYVLPFPHGTHISQADSSLAVHASHL